ncbi:hypothetical protein [Nostoc sp.]
MEAGVEFCLKSFSSSPASRAYPSNIAPQSEKAHFGVGRPVGRSLHRRLGLRRECDRLIAYINLVKLSYC